MSRRRIRLAPERMTERQLWDYLQSAFLALDPLSLTYVPGQAHHLSLNGLDALRELRLRGVQLALELPETHHRPHQVA